MLTITTIPLPARLVVRLESIVQESEGRGRLRRRGRGAAYRQVQAAAASTVLANGRCTSVELHHETPPGVMAHEHGVLVFSPIDAGSTHLQEISSVGDDPRWTLYEAGGLMRREWRWIRIPQVGTFEFTASGAEVVPVDLGEFHGTQLEVLLTEGDDGWPGDDAIVGIGFDEIARLART